MSVNENIRRLRVGNSLSIDSFAGLTGLSVADCQKIEAGTRPLSSAEVQKICSVLDVDVDTLMTATIPDPEARTEGSVLMPIDELQNLLGKMQE